MTHHDHLLYLKKISFVSMIFLLPCNIPTQIVKPPTVIKRLVSSPLKTNHTIPLLPNNRTHITNCSLSQPKIFRTWYKQNTKPNINHLLLNIHHLFEILLKNFHQFTIIVLFEIKHIYWTRTNESPQTLSSPLSHI